jgi:hypothetical protein
MLEVSVLALGKGKRVFQCYDEAHGEFAGFLLGLSWCISFLSGFCRWIWLGFLYSFVLVFLVYTSYVFRGASLFLCI